MAHIDAPFRPIPIISVVIAPDVVHPGPGSVRHELARAAHQASRAYASNVVAAAAEILRQAFGPTAHQAVFEDRECDAGDATCMHINLRLVTAEDGEVLWYDEALFGTALVRARDEAEAYGGPVLARLDDETHQAIIDLVRLAELAVPGGYLPPEVLILDPDSGEIYDGETWLMDISEEIGRASR
jgi:hypothetical protein